MEIVGREEQQTHGWVSGSICVGIEARAADAPLPFLRAITISVCKRVHRGHPYAQERIDCLLAVFREWSAFQVQSPVLRAGNIDTRLTNTTTQSFEVYSCTDANSNVHQLG
jgi:hypothetical protein